MTTLASTLINRVSNCCHEKTRTKFALLERKILSFINPAKVQTNIVIFDIGKSGLSSSEFLARLAGRKVLGVPVDGERVRMVTHLDVDRNDVEQAAETIRELLQSHL